MPDATQDQAPYIIPPDKLTALLRGLPMANPAAAGGPMVAPPANPAPVAAGVGGAPIPPGIMPEKGVTPAPAPNVASNVASLLGPTPPPPALQPETTTSQLVRATPPPARSPRYEQAAANLAKPAPNRADYKPGWRQYLGGALTAFGAGYGHDPNAAQRGMDVMQRPYTQALGAWSTGHEAAKDVMGAEEKAYQDTTANYRNLLQQQYREDTLGERERYHTDLNKVRQENNDVRQQLADLKAEAQGSGVPKNDTERIEREAKRRFPLNEQKQYEFAQSELVKLKQAERPPREPKNRSQYEDAYDAFRRENGREPNADEIAKLGRGERAGAASVPTFRDKESIDKFSNKWYADARKQARLEKSAVLTDLVKESGGGKPDSNELHRRYAEIEKGYQEQAAQHEADKKQWYANVGAPGSFRRPAPNPGAVKPNAPAQGGPPPAEDRVRVQSPDGKVGTVPRSQLPQAKTQGYKEVAGQ